MQKTEKKSMPESDYHATEAMSVSQLKQFIDSPSKWEYRRDHNPETKAMQIGTAFHAAILTPDVFESNYICEPKIDRRTKEGKEKAMVFEADNANKIILPEHDFITISEMRDRLMRIEMIKHIVKNGTAESSFFFQRDGIDCKARIDLYTHAAIFDLKTTASVREHDFSRQIYNMKYHMQAAFYVDVMAEFGNAGMPFIFIAIEKEPPYDARIYLLDDDSIKVGREAYKLALSQFKHYQLMKKTEPNLNDKIGISNISIPDWSKQ